MPSVGNTLTYLRKRADMTQEQLATALGVSKSAIGMYERNRRTPDLETLETIADFFNVDMNFLTSCEKKEAALASEDDLSPLDIQFMDMLNLLSGDQKEMLLAQIETLLKRQQ